MKKALPLWLLGRGRGTNRTALSPGGFAAREEGRGSSITHAKGLKKVTAYQLRRLLLNFEETGPLLLLFFPAEGDRKTVYFSTMASALFEDIFHVNEVDAGGKKFEKVSRFDCTSESYEMQLLLDVNVDVYPLEVNQKFSFMLTSTVKKDGAPDEDNGWDSHTSKEKKTLLDDYDYAMYGKVFKWEEDNSDGAKVAVYASFGGLLMMLKGEPNALSGVTPDSRIYLLMRKV
jgi:DNA-directed RNA polymerases I, II, and III subunit RPABC3